MVNFGPKHTITFHSSRWKFCVHHDQLINGNYGKGDQGPWIWWTLDLKIQLYLIPASESFMCTMTNCYVNYSGGEQEICLPDI